jgi:hypothetical protein
VALEVLGAEDATEATRQIAAEHRRRRKTSPRLGQASSSNTKPHRRDSQTSGPSYEHHKP